MFTIIMIFILIQTIIEIQTMPENKRYSFIENMIHYKEKITSFLVILAVVAMMDFTTIFLAIKALGKWP
jgi:hypothetical protein